MNPRPTGYSPGDYADLTREDILAAMHERGVERPEDIEIAMIWAQTTAGVIGDGKEMPWYLPEDLEHFKNATFGYPVVMGRTSWEALEDPYRPLPGRENFVVTRRKDYDAPGGTVEKSLPEGIAAAAKYLHDLQKSRTEGADSSGSSKGARELTNTVWILGGGQVYAQCMDVADRVVITDIDMTAAERFTVFAPEVPSDEFSATVGEWLPSERGHTSEGEGGLRYRIVEWVRR